MFQEFLSSSHLLDLPVLVMLFFMAVFGLVVLRVCRRHRKPIYDRMARLPLDDAEEVTS